jgi:hypothetical protein
MVILLPVIAGDSTIPKWVLAGVPASRDRVGFTKQLRNQGIRWTLLCLYFCLNTYFRLAKQKFVLNSTNPETLFLLILNVGIVVSSIGAIVQAFQARKWLDKHESWPEVAGMQWHEPVISRLVSGWVTALVFLVLAVAIGLFWVSLTRG